MEDKNKITKIDKNSCIDTLYLILFAIINRYIAKDFKKNVDYLYINEFDHKKFIDKLKLSDKISTTSYLNKLEEYKSTPLKERIDIILDLIENIHSELDDKFKLLNEYIYNYILNFKILENN